MCSAARGLHCDEVLTVTVLSPVRQAPAEAHLVVFLKFPSLKVVRAGIFSSRHLAVDNVRTTLPVSVMHTTGHDYAAACRALHEQLAACPLGSPMAVLYGMCPP